MTHPTWGDKPPRVAGSLPRMRPDQELQVALTRAGSGPAPQSPVVVARLVLVGGGTVSGVFVYDPTIGFGHLVGWMTSSAADPFGDEVDGVIGTQNNVTGAEVFLTKNADIQFNDSLFTSTGQITSHNQNAGTVPYPAPYMPIDAPEQTTTGHMKLVLLGSDSGATKGPWAILGQGSKTGGQFYANQTCWYAPGIGTIDDGAAMNAIYALGVTTIRLLPGTANIVTTPAIPDSCSLFGCGLSSVLKLANNSGAVQNVVANAANANNVTIANLLVDGNRANNAGTWQGGIVFQNPSTDPHHQVRGVKIQNCTGDGFVQAGRGGGTLVSDVSIIHCDGFGVNTIFDTGFVNVDIGNSGIDGFLIQGGSTRISNCKAWFSGDKLVSSRGASATLLTVTPPANAWDGGGIGALSFSLANGWGNGFHWTNISGASQGPAGKGGTNAALTAQDNARAGFYNDGTGGAGPPVVIAGVEADSNNNCGTNGGVANGAFAGIDWGATGGVVEGKSFDRGSNVCKQQAALNVVATSGFIGNRFRLHFEGTNPGALADGSNMPPLTAGSVPTSNDCEFNAQGRSLRPVAASGTVAVDPYLAHTFSTTITGAITFSNPALTGTNTTGLFLVQGMRIALAVTQDGVGGHVVTLGAAYKTNGEVFSSVAGATTVIEFVWDGSFWQAMS